MNSGVTTFAKIDRKIIQWEWYTDIPTKVLFIHLFLVANHQPQSWRGHTIERGQRLTSLGSLSNETGLTIQQVRTAIKKLKSTGEITTKSTNKNTIITIVNYGLYQGDYNDSNKQDNKQTTIKQQTSNKQVTTNNNVKNDKNDNNVKNNTNMPVVPYKEIIDHLNQRTGRRFRVTDTYRKHMNARFNEGFTLEDFKIVIDKKCVEWMGTEWEQYLRPHTLFGTKFDGYLNQDMTNFKKKSSNPYADMVFDEEGNLIG